MYRRPPSLVSSCSLDFFLWERGRLYTGYLGLWSPPVIVFLLQGELRRSTRSRSIFRDPANICHREVPLWNFLKVREDVDSYYNKSSKEVKIKGNDKRSFQKLRIYLTINPCLQEKVNGLHKSQGQECQ